MQGQQQVAVIGANNKVSIRNVTLGQQYETYWVVEKGLKEGERVVTEGIAKAQDGGTVTPKPAKQASAAKQQAKE